MSDPVPPASDSWSFARHFYAEPEVADACLGLQDDLGADVCLVLHLLHLALMCRSVSAASVAGMAAAARPWRESVIVPLRLVRRGLRQPPAGYAGAAALRTSVAAMEIEAERMQLAFLDALDTTAQPATPPPAAARNNLAAYCDLLGQPPESVNRLLALFDGYHSVHVAE